jgi:hypothetical protein
VDAWGPELVLTRRWYSHGLWPLLLFCIIWDGFLIVWYTIGVRELISGERGLDAWAAVLMLVVPVLHVLVGLAMTYAVISGFLNRTIVRVAGGELSVWHGPFPWPYSQRLFTADIKQVYCTQAPRRAGDNGATTYNLLAVTGKNDEVTLLRDLRELGDGQFIEQRSSSTSGFATRASPARCGCDGRSLGRRRICDRARRVLVRGLPSTRRGRAIGAGGLSRRGGLSATGKWRDLWRAQPLGFVTRGGPLVAAHSVSGAPHGRAEPPFWARSWLVLR